MSSEIAKFYSGKSIFITGATGLLGKVTVEKILYSCPEVKSIYVLIRCKKNESAHERFEKFIQSKAFGRLNHDAIEKMKLIEGDISSEYFNLSDADRHELQANVNIIIHTAAVIKFNESLQSMMSSNVVPIYSIVNLARSLQNLSAICYVSSAYSQCDKTKCSTIEEKIYDPPITYKEILDQLKTRDDAEIYKFSYGEPNKHPNSYTLSKSIAEHMLATEGKGLPIVIIRPSLVASSVTEPFPGWTDTFQSMHGSMAGIMTGVIRTWIGRECSHDIVPLDYTCNYAIASTWFVAQHYKEWPLVCNFVTGNNNKISLPELVRYTLKKCKSLHMEKTIRTPSFNARENPFVYEVEHTVKHVIPAYLADGISRVRGGKPRMVRRCRRIDAEVKAIRFYTMNEWKWSNDNAKMIQSFMNESDIKEFNFDMRSFDWEEFGGVMAEGINRYLLSDNNISNNKNKGFEKSDLTQNNSN